LVFCHLARPQLKSAVGRNEFFYGGLLDYDVYEKPCISFKIILKGSDFVKINFRDRFTGGNLGKSQPLAIPAK